MSEQPTPMSEFQRLLGLSTPPVAVAFLDAPPAGLPRAGSAEPAGCGYWRRAAEGEAFYTEAADHHGCPIGAHTHGAALPPEKKKELEGMLETMAGLGYLKLEEVPGIPHRDEPLRCAAYAPLDRAPFPADAVLFRGTVKQLMLLAEAAQAAGCAGETPAMGRPTCAVLPAALASGKTAASFGCVGNRVYTGAPDDEAYFAAPGSALAALETALGTIVAANAELEKFHLARAAEARQ